MALRLVAGASSGALAASAAVVTGVAARTAVRSATAVQQAQRRCYASDPDDVVAPRDRGTFDEHGRPLGDVIADAMEDIQTRAANETFDDLFDRHKPVVGIMDHKPYVSPNAYVAPSATILGNVMVGNRTSIGYGAVLRGDFGGVRVTHGVAIGDNTVVEGLPDLAAFVGSGSRVGHNAVIRGSYVDEEVSVGDSATVLESRVDTHAMIADGAVVHNAHVQSGQFWAGAPAVYVRDLDEDEIDALVASAEADCEVGQEHYREFVLDSHDVYVDLERISKGNKAASGAGAPANANVA